MDNNKNQEMSVEELLEKLKESLQSDADNKPSSENVDDADIRAAVTAAINNSEVAEQAIKTEAETLTEESAMPEDVQEPFTEEADKEEDIVVPDAAAFVGELEENHADEGATVEVSVADAVEESEASETIAADDEAEKNAPGLFTEEDILAAWGLERADIDAQKVELAEKSEEKANEYIAPYAVATKMYHITRVEHKVDFLSRKQAEAQKSTVDYDKTDYSLIKQALGIEKTEDTASASLFTVFEEDTSAAQPKTIHQPHSEFTYQRQKDDIATDYRAMSRASGVKLLFTSLIAVLLFLLECLPVLGVEMPHAISFEYYPIVFVMASMQLVWLCGAFSYKEIANGALSMLKFRFTSGSLLAILVFMSTVCNILVCALGLETYCYNFAVAFCAVLVRVFDYFDVRREMLSFEIASSTQSKKYVATIVDKTSAEHVEGLEDYTGEDSLILRTEKCSFVENYFSRTERRCENEIAANKIFIPILLAVSALSLIISIAKGNSAAAVVSSFYLTLAASLPVLVLIAASYPLYKAVRKLYRNDSTIIGENTVDEYSGTTMIYFDDADAFPSYGVALENLRIYGKGDIETIIEQMGAVFSKVGGPLKSVFSLMTSECPRPYKVKIEGVYENGLAAVVDGKTLFIGNSYFMEEQGFKVLDKSSEIGGKRFSTMYLAQDGSLRAKFYIRYTLDGSFETIIKKLARRGIASVILTGDSNINDELLSRSLDIANLPVKIMRRRDFDTATVGDRADSGIVSCGSVGDLVSALTMCDKLAGVISTMRALRVASVIICAFLMIGSCLLNMQGVISPLYVLIYQLFWLIPSWLVSKFNI